MVWVKVQESCRRHPVVCQVPVPRQNGIGARRYRANPNKVADGSIAQSDEARRRLSRVGWANHQFRRHQFVGQHLEMTERKIKLTCDAISAAGKLQRAARADRNRHGKLTIMILGKILKGNAELAEMTDTFDPPGP